MNLPVNLINLIKSKKGKKKRLEKKKIRRNRAAEAKSQKNRRCGQDRGGALHATINFDVVRRSADTNTMGGVGGVNNRGHDRFVIREQTTRSQRGPGPWNNYCACN